MKSETGKLYGICRLSVACLRKHAQSASPLVSQLLFGECVEIVNIPNKRWARVACCRDESVGWIDPKQLHILSGEEYSGLEERGHFSLELIYGILSDEISIPVTIGAVLYGFDGINVRMPFGKFRFSGQVFSPANTPPTQAVLLKVAGRFLNAPHMKGGRSILGLDAPAFVQLVYSLLGIDLPRQATQQAQRGEDIGFPEHARIGDLAFFQGSKAHLQHVGLITGPQEIMHVYGRVKTDRIDQQGLYDLEERRYIFRLRSIRRICELPESADSLAAEP